MRAEEDDPMYQVTFKTSGEYNVYKKRRVGRPRGSWAEESMSMALEELEGMEFDRDNPHQRMFIFSEAIARKF